MNIDGMTLFLYFLPPLVSSNLNSKLFRFHCVKPNLYTYPLFFNEEFKFLVRNFPTLILKQSMFEDSESLHKTEGKKIINNVIPSIFMKF